MAKRELKKHHAVLRAEHPIRRRKIFKRSCINVLISITISSILTFGILGLMWFYSGGHEENFIYSLNSQKDSLLFILSVLTLWIIWYPIYQYLYFVSYYYDLDEDNLYIKKGVATKRELTIPFSKITDVYLDQDIVDIVLGLYDLHVSTPTTESLKFAHIAGLNRKSALEIKRAILNRINKNKLIPLKPKVKKALF